MFVIFRCIIVEPTVVMSGDKVKTRRRSAPKVQDPNIMLCINDESHLRRLCCDVLVKVSVKPLTQTEIDKYPHFGDNAVTEFYNSDYQDPSIGYQQQLAARKRPFDYYSDAASSGSIRKRNRRMSDVSSTTSFSSNFSKAVKRTSKAREQPTTSKNQHDEDLSDGRRSTRRCFPKHTHFMETIFSDKAKDSPRIQSLLNQKRDKDAIEEMRQNMLRNVKGKNFSALSNNLDECHVSHENVIENSAGKVNKHSGILRIKEGGKKVSRSIYAQEIRFIVLFGDVRVMIGGVLTSQICASGQEIYIDGYAHYDMENLNKTDPAYLYFVIREQETNENSQLDSLQQASNFICNFDTSFNSNGSQSPNGGLSEKVEILDE